EPIWNQTRVLPRPDGESADVRHTQVFEGPRPGARGVPEPGPSGDSPRPPRRWRGADEYRNLWTGRAPETGPLPVTRQEYPAADRYRDQTRVDCPPSPAELPAAGPGDGNGSGVPLNWDDE
ncbi:MAG TPA: hypothetical protein VGD91_15565, partial [Trebonia sp.]